MTDALIVCAHGTDDPDGQQVVRDITAQVARLLPAVHVTDAYVDVQRPELPDVVNDLAAQHDSVTVVPLLLSYGFHVEVDVARAVERHANARSTGQLGPHPVLAGVLADRLREAGTAADGPVVLAVAGSSRPAARDDAEAMRELLAQRWAGPVELGYLAAAQPSVAEAVATVPGAYVASYLIGPGFFQRKLERDATGAVGVTAPLGADPRLADLVVQNYLGA